MNVYDKATQLLKIRPHYSAELAKKLSLRGFAKLDIDDAINRLIEQGLLNDAQYAQAYTEELIRNKSFGFYGLKAKLMQRGIPGNDAEQLLKENFTLEKEKEIALRVAERAGNIDKNKLALKLSRKGFRSEVIREIIK
ncbi:MAG: RecX family transcriptional regulator [Candidatus Doudnabacteria bacterium]